MTLHGQIKVPQTASSKVSFDSLVWPSYFLYLAFVAADVTEDKAVKKETDKVPDSEANEIKMEDVATPKSNGSYFPSPILPRHS